MNNIAFTENMHSDLQETNDFYDRLDNKLEIHEELSLDEIKALREMETVKRFANWTLFNLIDNPKELTLTCLKMVDPSLTYDDLSKVFDQDRQTAFRQVKRFVKRNPKFSHLLKTKE